MGVDRFGVAFLRDVYFKPVYDVRCRGDRVFRNGNRIVVRGFRVLFMAAVPADHGVPFVRGVALFLSVGGAREMENRLGTIFEYGDCGNCAFRGERTDSVEYGGVYPGCRCVCLSDFIVRDAYAGGVFRLRADGQSGFKTVLYRLNDFKARAYRAFRRF